MTTKHFVGNSRDMKSYRYFLKWNRIKFILFKFGLTHKGTVLFDWINLDIAQKCCNTFAFFVNPSAFNVVVVFISCLNF